VPNPSGPYTAPVRTGTGRLLAAFEAFRGVMGSRDLRRVLLAFICFTSAELASWIAVLVYAYSATGPGSVGFVAVALLVPAAAAAPLASSAGDRFSRERVLLVGYLVIAATKFGIALAVAAGAPAAVVYAAAAGANLAAVIVRPAQSSLLPAHASTPDELAAANSVATASEGIGVLLGPALAAVLLGLADAVAVFAAAAVVALVAAILVAGVRPLSRTRHLREALGFGSLLAGVEIVERDRDSRVVVGLLSARACLIGAMDVLFVLIAIQLFGIGKSGVGMLNASMGIGLAIGGLLTLLLVGRRSLAPGIELGALVWGIGLALIAVVPWTFVALAILVLGGAGLALMDASGRTMLQRITHEDVLSRVFGVLEGTSLAALSVGSLGVAVLSNAFELRAVIVIMSAVLPVAAAATWRHLAEIDAHVVVPVTEIELLASTRIFAPLPAPALEATARRLVAVLVTAGARVITEGDPGDRFYVVASGTAEVTSGGRSLGIVGAGGYFGEIALLRSVPRTATVTALTDLSLYALERDDFLAVMTGSEQAAAAAERDIDAALSQRAEAMLAEEA
jgi:MFS family permease